MAFLSVCMLFAFTYNVEAAGKIKLNISKATLEVYMEMLEAGINVPMVRKYMGNEVADAMQQFCEEHGLI